MSTDDSQLVDSQWIAAKDILQSLEAFLLESFSGTWSRGGLIPSISFAGASSSAEETAVIQAPGVWASSTVVASARIDPTVYVKMLTTIMSKEAIGICAETWGQAVWEGQFDDRQTTARTGNLGVLTAAYAGFFEPRCTLSLLAELLACTDVKPSGFWFGLIGSFFTGDKTISIERGIISKLVDEVNADDDVILLSAPVPKRRRLRTILDEEDDPDIDMNDPPSPFFDPTSAFFDCSTGLETKCDLSASDLPQVVRDVVSLVMHHGHLRKGLVNAGLSPAELKDLPDRLRYFACVFGLVEDLAFWDSKQNLEPASSSSSASSSHSLIKLVNDNNLVQQWLVASMPKCDLPRLVHFLSGGKLEFKSCRTDVSSSTPPSSAMSKAVRDKAKGCTDRRFKQLLLDLADALDHKQPDLKTFLVQKLNHYWFAVTHDGPIRYGEEFDVDCHPFLRNKTEFKNAFENWNIPLSWIDRKCKTGSDIQLVPMWCLHHSRIGYRAMTFNPSGSSLESKEDYNVFKGLAIDRKAAAAAAASASAPSVQPVLDHVLKCWSRGDEAPSNKAVSEYVLDWMALLVQKPGQLPATCIQLFGEQGSGKGVIVGLLGKIIGERHYIHTTDSDDVVGKFTGHLARCLLLFADEVTISTGSKKAGGRFKALVTEVKQRIAEKFKGTRYLPNYTHVITASNFKPAIESSDRRTLFLETDNKYSGPKTPDSEKYFDKLLSVPAEVFAHHLYNRDLSQFNSRILPMTKARRDLMAAATKARREQMDLAAKSPEAFWIGCLKNGRLGDKGAETKANGKGKTKAKAKAKGKDKGEVKDKDKDKDKDTEGAGEAKGAENEDDKDMEVGGSHQDVIDADGGRQESKGDVKGTAEWPELITKKDMFKLYETACAEDKMKKMADSLFWPAMYRLLGLPKEDLETRPKSSNERSIKLPDLDACRKAFRSYRKDLDYPFDD